MNRYERGVKPLYYQLVTTTYNIQNSTVYIADIIDLMQVHVVQEFLERFHPAENISNR